VTTFVDTNVLVYAHDLSETRRRPIAQATSPEVARRNNRRRLGGGPVDDVAVPWVQVPQGGVRGSVTGRPA
jgi:hypothetical protein